MIKFNMIGGGFQHDICSCAQNTPKYIEWDKTTHSADISVHIDSAIMDIPTNPSKTNIAWFAESPYFVGPLIKRLESLGKLDVLENYEYVLTSDKSIIKKYPRFQYIIPTARPWVREKKIFPKTKWASIIASAKRDSLGHQLRHMIIDQYGGHIDVFGGGYNPIHDKGEGLNDFLYSFAIENTQCDGYFTEKISDCFATGTIPIYWGDDTISQYFIEDGIIKLTNEFDADILTPELYKNKKAAIEENFARVMNLPTPEDEIYIKYLK